MTRVRFTIICSNEENRIALAKELVKKNLRPFTYRILSQGDAVQHEMGLVVDCDVREQHKLLGYSGRVWRVMFDDHYIHSKDDKVLELVKEIPRGDLTLRHTGLIFSTMYGQLLVCKRYNKEL